MRLATPSGSLRRRSIRGLRAADLPDQRVAESLHRRRQFPSGHRLLLNAALTHLLIRWRYRDEAVVKLTVAYRQQPRKT